MRELRWAGYAMFAVSGVWLLAADTPGALREDFTPFLNEYTISYAAGVVLPALAGWLLHLRRDSLESWERIAPQAMALRSAVFAAVVVPVQVDGIWIPVAWAVEAALMLWLSFPLRMREARWFGYVMFAVCAAWLAAVDSPAAFRDDLTPFLNLYMVGYAALGLSAAFSSWLLWRRRDGLESYEQAAYPVFAVAAAASVAVVIPMQLESPWIPVAWAAEALFLFWLSSPLKMRELRWAGYGLLAVMLARLLALDTFDVDLDTFRPALNWRFLAFAVGIAALYAAGFLFLRRPPEDDGSPVGEAENRMALPALLTLANAATLWLLSAEIIATANSAFLGLSVEASENVASLGLSLLWAAYAAVLIVVGVTRRLRWVRLAGLALLAVPVVKLFAYDSRTLEQEYRVIAFIALGIILLAGGLLYQRYRQAVRGFLFE